MVNLNKNNFVQKYSAISILLHWIVALLIIFNFILGLVMVNIPGITPAKLKYFSWHKWIGIMILALVSLRFIWRLFKAPPNHLPMPSWQKKISKITHLLLYFLMFGVPISGYFYSLAAGIPVVMFGIWPLPIFIEADQSLKLILKITHISLVYSMTSLVIIHILAVIKHQFIDRDNLIKRMIF